MTMLPSAFNAPNMTYCSKTAQPQFSAAKASVPRFGNLATETIGKTKLELRSPGKLLKSVDFQDFGQSVVNQVKIIYGVIILSRILAAAHRSRNEVRETIVRDSLGYTFWLFTVPMLERLMLYAMDRKYDKGLIQLKPKPESAGAFGPLKQLNHAVNPLARWDMPSSRQIRDRGEQVLKQLTVQGHAKDSALYQNTQKVFEGLVHKRNLIQGVGVLLTIGMLGVVLPLINIAVTRRKLSEGSEGKANMPNFIAQSRLMQQA